MATAITTECPETFPSFQARISINPCIKRGEVSGFIQNIGRHFYANLYQPLNPTRPNFNYSDLMDTWCNTFDESLKAAKALYDIQRINLLNPDRQEILVRPGDVHYTDLAKCHSAWKDLETLIATFMRTMSVTEQDLSDWQIKPVPLAEEFMEFFSTKGMLDCKKNLASQTKLMKEHFV
ncbi:hypothetical protein MMC31_004519 [Peltigera leucophlebia]|nr:hypothetical protein [Peltigera leucophlebia]